MMNNNWTIMTDDFFDELIDNISDKLNQIEMKTIKDFDVSDKNIDSQGFLQLIKGGKGTIKYCIRNGSELSFDEYTGSEDINKTILTNDNSKMLVKSLIPTTYNFRNMTTAGVNIVKKLMPICSPSDFRQFQYINVIPYNQVSTLAASYNVNNGVFVIYFNDTYVAELCIDCAVALLMKSPKLKLFLLESHHEELRYMLDVLVNYSFLYVFLHELSHIQYRDVINDAKIIRDSLGGKFWKRAGMDNLLEDSYINDRLNLRIGGMSDVSAVLKKLDIISFDLPFGISGRLNNEYKFNDDVLNQKSVSSLKSYLRGFDFQEVENAEILFDFVEGIDPNSTLLLSALNMKSARSTYVEFITPYANLLKALVDFNKSIRKRHIKFTHNDGNNQGNKSGNKGSNDGDQQSGSGGGGSGENPPTIGILKKNGCLMGVDSDYDEIYHIFGPYES